MPERKKKKQSDKVRTKQIHGKQATVFVPMMNQLFCAFCDTPCGYIGNKDPQVFLLTKTRQKVGGIGCKRDFESQIAVLPKPDRAAKLLELQKQRAAVDPFYTPRSVYYPDGKLSSSARKQTVEV
jgi:hypothetical protein